ncbi:MAG: nucleoside hydrolase [Synergistaceae bacterium]|nr:nucleoside hydrolase [Synergistaceae bacterium]
MRKHLILCAVLVFAAVFSSAAAFAAYPEVKRVILDSDMRPGPDDGTVLCMMAGWTRIGNSMSEAAYTAEYPGHNKIEFLGITVVAGNESEPRGLAHGVRQLEIISADQITVPGTSIPVGIPIYEGSHYGLRGSRMNREVLEAEFSITGPVGYQGYFGWATSSSYANNPDRDPMQPWMNFYNSTAGGGNGSGNGYGGVRPGGPTYPYAFYPKQIDGTPANADPNGIDNAVDFIIHTINTNPPNTISILAIGPLTNVALALRKDPGIAARAKEIVYMGGSFYMKGNSSAAAEYNWWADPEAAKICVRTAWGDRNSNGYLSYGNQVVSGLEAHAFLELLNSNHPSSTARNRISSNPAQNPQALTAEETEWFSKSQYFYNDLVSQCRWYRNLPNAGALWDVIAGAWLVNPAVISGWYRTASESQTAATIGAMRGLYIDVDDDLTANYARSTAFSPGDPPNQVGEATGQLGPAGTQKAAIQAYTDETLFWNKIVAPSLMDPAKVSGSNPTPYIPSNPLVP